MGMYYCGGGSRKRWDDLLGGGDLYVFSLICLLIHESMMNSCAQNEGFVVDWKYPVRPGGDGGIFCYGVLCNSPIIFRFI